jgi:hypothetical protein
MLKKRTILLLLSLLAFAAAASGQGPLKRIVTKTDKLDFGVGGTVSIVGAPKGSIRVEPADGNQIEITAEVHLEAPTDADLNALEGVTGFVLQESLGSVSINTVGTNDKKYLKQTAKKFPKGLIGLPFSIDYAIKVPRYCDLQIDGGVGDISVSGIEGNLRINSLDSNTKLDLVGGGVNGTFEKGKLLVTMPDRSWRGNSVDIALATGEMEVWLPATLSAELDASILRSGKIENALSDLKPRVRTVKFTEQNISAKAGSGGVPMKFTVGEGVLRLKTIGRAQ